MFGIIEGRMAKGRIEVKPAGSDPGYWTAPITSAYFPPRRLPGLEEPGKAERRPLSAP